ncbi:hypothetical protein [Streptomyces sp. NPDC057686]
MTATLMIGESQARALLGELADAGLLEGARPFLTEQGRSTQDGSRTPWPG